MSVIGPTPATGSALFTKYLYDAMGRVAGALNPGTPHGPVPCTTPGAEFPDKTYPPHGAQTGTRTVTYGYTGDGTSGTTAGDPLTSWEQDSDNTGRITRMTNLDGQQTGRD